MGARVLSLPDDVVERIRAFLKRECGLIVPASKYYLFEQRLGPLLDKRVPTFDALASALERGGDAALRQKVVHLMTTHETSFFRDPHAFDFISRTLLPKIGSRIAERKRNRQPLRPFPIWSAACSTGQEPYSLAMLVQELLEHRPDLGLGWRDFSLLATDISLDVLRSARAGEFDSTAMSRGLTPARKEKFFTEQPNTRVWRAADELRRSITFRPMSLTRRFTQMGPFDFVLCRNVLIYFDQETRMEVLRQIAVTLAPGGVLMLGSSESIFPDMPEFKKSQSGRVLYYERV